MINGNRCDLRVAGVEEVSQVVEGETPRYVEVRLEG